MGEKVFVDPAELSIDLILANSCANESTTSGWLVYDIRLHCVVFRVTARQVEVGRTHHETGAWIVPPHYEIKSYEIVSN